MHGLLGKLAVWYAEHSNIVKRYIIVACSDSIKDIDCEELLALLQGADIHTGAKQHGRNDVEDKHPQGDSQCSQPAPIANSCMIAAACSCCGAALPCIEVLHCGSLSIQ